MKTLVVCFERNHYEFLITLCKLFLSIGDEVSVATSEDLATLVEDLDTVKVHSRPKGESAPPFLLRISLAFTNVDRVIFDEWFDLNRDWRFIFAPLKRCQVWLAVHSANSWFRPTPGLSMKAITKTIVRKALLNQVDGVIVTLDSMATHLRRECRVSRPVVVLPFSLPTEVSPPETRFPNATVELVIPGMIDLNRRYYHRVLGALERIPVEKCPISVTLLGRAREAAGMGVVERFKKAAKRGYKIKTYDNFVPIEEFSGAMLSADLILSDIVPTTRRDGTQEIYGETKDTGVTYHIVKYGIPAILPRHFTAPAELSGAILAFGDEVELSDLLSKLASHDLPEMRRLTRIATRSYTDRLTRDFEQIFHLGVFSSDAVGTENGHR